MIQLTRSLEAWDTSDFAEILKREVEGLPAEVLPLQQGLSAASHVAERPFQTRFISATADDKVICAKLGIFYSGIIAGCSCADDPTPVDELSEYCVVRLDINRTTAHATVTLLAE